MLLSKTRLIGIEKKMYKWMEKRKANSRDNHKWQKPSSEHRHIKYVTSHEIFVTIGIFGQN